MFNVFMNDSVEVLLINNNYDNDNVENFKIDSSEENMSSEEDNDENATNEVIADSFYNEEDVVNYFENIELEIESSTSFKEKFREYFILIVDFIFYNGEIKGYSFAKLSDGAKIKIIAIALKIDNKIEEYIPNYKEYISSTGGKIYNNVKERCVSLYMDISVDICTTNKDECDKVKDVFAEIKNVCKIGWDYIMKLTSKGVTKLKDWYEVYSGK